MRKDRIRTFLLGAPFVIVALFIAFVFFVDDVFAAELQPREREMEVGLVVGHRPLFYDAVQYFPDVDKVAWTYAGYWNSTRPELAEWEMIPYHDQGTYRNRPVEWCAPRMFVLHSPQGRPVGYYATFDDAVEIVQRVAEQCPDAELLVGNASPHNYCLYGYNLPFCGTGAEWVDYFLKSWVTITLRKFPYTLSIILSENHSRDDYPIRNQALDNWLVAQRHGVEKIVVSFYNSKDGDYHDTLNGLRLAEALGFDAVFVASPRSHFYGKYFISTGKSANCYRALICGVMQPEYTPAGKALIDFLKDD